MRKAIVVAICCSLISFVLLPGSLAQKITQGKKWKEPDVAAASPVKPVMGNPEGVLDRAMNAAAPGQQGIASTVVKSGKASPMKGVVGSHRTSGPIYKEVPPLTREQSQELEREQSKANPMIVIPPGEGTRVINAPLDPPTDTPISRSGLLPPGNFVNSFEKVAGTEVNQAAPTDFIYRTVRDIPAGAALNRSTVGEPSLANMGNTIFYTGNWYAAISTDGGQSFGYVNPATTLNPTVNKGFCCDQLANYAPKQNMMLWAVQYESDGTSGTLRLARAVGSSAVANNQWVYSDFNPQMFGFPTGTWMDFPGMTVGATYVYLTSNVFDNASTIVGSVVWRISLAELAAGGGINYSYMRYTDVGALKTTEGAGTTMYWATHLDASYVRIFHWNDGPGDIYSNDVKINPYAPFTRDQKGIAVSPDGTNWAANVDSRILGAWVANGVIGLMWGAKQDADFPYPYTIVASFNQSTRALMSQNYIWNPQFAWLYPTVSVNAAGNLAGLLVFGGGAYYPGSSVWISDDVQNGFSPVTLYSAAQSNAGPIRNNWGDYHTVRPHKDYPNTWVAGTYYLLNGGDGFNAVPRYLWFGRERDFASGGTSNRVTAGLYNPSTSAFFLKNTNAGGGADLTFSYGPAGAGWAPMAGDWDGNGTETIGLYNPSTSMFFLKNTNSAGSADMVFSYGPAGAGWTPLAGDWDGNGTETVGLYNPSTGTFFLKNINSPGGANLTFSYGPAGAGWMPVVGDWDGNGVDTVGLYNPSTSAFFLTNAHSAGPAGIVFSFGPSGSGWRPLVGDWDGNGTDTIGLYNPSTSMFFLKNINSAGGADVTFSYGPASAGWRPLMGNWDGV